MIVAAVVENVIDTTLTGIIEGALEMAEEKGRRKVDAQDVMEAMKAERDSLYNVNGE